MTRKPVLNALSRFWRDEKGAMIVETIMVLPLLLWAFMGLYVYWDAYRSITVVQKAAYTVSDLLSRQRDGVTSAYIVGMDNVVEYLIDEDQDVSTRVTSVTWNDVDKRFEVHWSRANGDMAELTTATLQPLAGQIPDMAPNDFAVIVEVNVPYVPAFDVGLVADGFRQFIVTRPRFLPCIPMDAVPCPVAS